MILKAVIDRTVNAATKYRPAFDEPGMWKNTKGESDSAAHGLVLNVQPSARRGTLVSSAVANGQRQSAAAEGAYLFDRSRSRVTASLNPDSPKTPFSLSQPSIFHPPAFTTPK